MISTFAELSSGKMPSFVEETLTAEERQQLGAQLDAVLVADGDVCHVCGEAAVSPGADYCHQHAPRECEGCGAEMRWNQTPSGLLCWTCLNKIY